MLKLTQTELFNSSSTFAQSFIKANKEIISGKGNILPEQIEKLSELQDYAKKSSTSSPLLVPALDMYLHNTGIKLFDLNFGVSSSSLKSSDMPPFIPFFPAVDPEDHKPKIYVNMYRLGPWSSDDKYYEDLAVLTDLQTALESAYIGYKLILENKADSVLNNAIVKQRLGSIYAQMSYRSFVKVQKYPLADFQLEMIKFVLAKFFFIYILQNSVDDQTVNSYAMMCAGSRPGSSLSTYVSYEETLGIDYTNLSRFIKSINNSFFNGHQISLSDYSSSWLQNYGELAIFAIEYVPYFLHMLFSSLHNSRLGGGSKLTMRKDLDFKMDDLRVLYNNICSLVK